MIDTELVAHQIAVRQARRHIYETEEVPASRMSAPTTRSGNPYPTLIRGSRADRSIITTREQRNLSSIKADAQNWIDRAYSPHREDFNWQDAKLALESLTSAFTNIKRDVPSLESLKDEVAGVLDTFEDVLNELQARSESTQDNSPIVHDTRKSHSICIIHLN